MTLPPARLYRDYTDDLRGQLTERLDSALSSSHTATPVPVFFRADDIGVPSPRFSRLIDTFRSHTVPLALAVVPTWLTHSRWAVIGSYCRPELDLWCWHQHGFSHRNHEPAGKKCEFGPHRTAGSIRRDIVNGRKRLGNILGDSFSPFFTPPWNRCSETTLVELEKLGFQAVSRSRGSIPDSSSLPDIQVGIDLHTRKEPDSASSLAALFLEIEQSVQFGQMGIMIHHQRMNDPAFTFLDDFLASVVEHPGLHPVALSSLV
jgi:hypothetical protein